MASYLDSNRVKTAEPRAHLKMARRNGRKPWAPAARAQDRPASDFTGASLHLSEFLAVSVAINIQISRSRSVWVPTEVGTLIDMRI